MTDSNATNASSEANSHVAAPIHAIEQGHARVGLLLAGLQESTPHAQEHQRGTEIRFENRLALVRLGIASSLYFALRTKHPPTAAHSLRVALNCSAWAERMGLDEATRDRLEVAALLHDVGKIGIPDRILRKPGKLTVDEQLTMDCCPQLGCEILRGCTNDADLLAIVLHANTWFDSRRDSDGPRGDALPLGSRMLAITNAFDAMTIDSVYRPAMSRERAIQELIDGSGTQFDPELALDFNRMFEQRPEMLQGVVVDRWLQKLRPESGESLWGAFPSTGQGEASSREGLFFEKLVGDLKDGVAFTDGEGTITHWNSVMQEMTGIAADAILSQSWSSECVRLRERDSSRDDNCLVMDCLKTGALVARSMLIERPGRDPIPVHIQVSPVIGGTRGIHGTVVIIRDLTDQADMEERLESLHHQTTRDPLTKVANRTCFDDELEQCIDDAASGKHSFSLIMCDIDHFKRVNDLHGHPAGDEALVSFAAILNSHSRDGDLVARYGGEEFLLLTPSCDNATAANRAEAIRRALETTPLRSIGGESISASFGVTEYQAGDTPLTVVARADRALLRAKDNGRNRVVQLGSGNSCELESETSKKGWLSWLTGEEIQTDSEVDLLTPVPLDLAIEKLRGFIADHNAELISVCENHVSLKLNAVCSKGGRRRADQQILLRVELTLSEMKIDPKKPLSCKRTNVHVHVQPIRNRDRRSTELSLCFRQVIASLKSYLMGEIRRPEIE